MAIFRQPIPRRAFLGAIVGALYSVLILPSNPPQSYALAAAWLLLSVSLLFAKPLAYHAFTFFVMIWIVWSTIAWFRERTHPLTLALDVMLPLVSLVLLMTSGYLDAAREAT